MLSVVCATAHRYTIPRTGRVGADSLNQECTGTKKQWYASCSMAGSVDGSVRVEDGSASNLFTVYGGNRRRRKFLWVTLYLDNAKGRNGLPSMIDILYNMVLLTGVNGNSCLANADQAKTTE